MNQRVPYIDRWIRIFIKIYQIDLLTVFKNTCNKNSFFALSDILDSLVAVKSTHFETQMTAVLQSILKGLTKMDKSERISGVIEHANDLIRELIKCDTITFTLYDGRIWDLFSSEDHSSIANVIVEKYPILISQTHFQKIMSKVANKYI